ncbi:MAG TPA: N-acetylmuramoyl-L-alanine amidase [Longimicrobium sp.]|nr:N-acetylmuramoyl-L-alanine amidase [Longimicrobium sp.]
MIRCRPVLLLLAALSLHTPPLSTQPAGTAWRLDGARAPVEVREETGRGYPALPASALVALGAEVAYEGGGAVARFGTAEARFTPGSPVVQVAGRSETLANAVYSEGGVVYVPAEFFGRWLGELSGGTLAVSADERSIRRVAAASAAAAVATAPEQPRAMAVRVAGRPAARRLVVVDAGHGGVDPGARGPGGTREKDVTLRVARQVAALLRQDPTLEVRMTRDRDTLIALHDRARMANRWRDEGQPAVFISIHCNANESRYEKGFETYFLSEARTADARRVENFENASVRFETNAVAGNPLGFILADLRQNHYLRESSDWAQIIQDALRDIHPGPNRGVKQAGFAVLRGTFMPAVLVEIGFVSNPAEERLLLDPHMEASIARQLAQSVRAHFSRIEVRPASE